MSDPGEGLSQGIQKRVIQHYAVIIKTLDMANLMATVEFKGSPGLLAEARIGTISGSGGTLYPPLKKGDVMWGEVSGEDLDQIMRDRKARRLTNPYLYDKSDVFIGFGMHVESGEAAGRKASAPPAEGEWLLVHETGVEIAIKANGEVIVKSSGNIYLGGKTGAKKVVLDGDAISGSGIDSGGDTVNVTGTAAADVGTKVFVGSP